MPGKASRQRAALHTSTSELHARPRAEGIPTIWTVTAQIASKNWEEHLVTPEKAGEQGDLGGLSVSYFRHEIPVQGSSLSEGVCPERYW